MQPEEVYYTCAWAVDGRNGDPLLAIAGLRGIIKIINCTSQTVVRVRCAMMSHVTPTHGHLTDITVCFDRLPQRESCVELECRHCKGMAMP